MKHLYEQSSPLKGLVKEESLLVNKKFFSSDIENAIDTVKSNFRAKHQLPENGTVIFFAPGNEVKEAEFCMENVRKGVKEFLLKYSAPTSLSPKAPGLDQYATVISVHRGSESETYIRNFIAEKGWYGRVVIVTQDENEHLSAMAASDLGMIYDGQMVGAAAACHLPTMVLIKMRMHH